MPSSAVRWAGPAGIEQVVILSTGFEICDDQETFPEQVVIYGYANSTA